MVAAAAAVRCRSARLPRARPKPAVGSPLTLTANCSQTPNRYDWMSCSYLTSKRLCNIMPACSATSDDLHGELVDRRARALRAWPAATVPARDRARPSMSNGRVAAVEAPAAAAAAAVAVSDLHRRSARRATAQRSAPRYACRPSCTGNPTSFSWTGMRAARIASARRRRPRRRPSHLFGDGEQLPAGNSPPRSVAVNWQARRRRRSPSCTLSASNSDAAARPDDHDHGVVHESPTSYTLDRLCVDQRVVHRLRPPDAGNEDVFADRDQRRAATARPRRSSVNWTVAADLAAGVHGLAEHARRRSSART